MLQHRHSHRRGAPLRENRLRRKGGEIPEMLVSPTRNRDDAPPQFRPVRAGPAGGQFLGPDRLQHVLRTARSRRRPPLLCRMDSGGPGSVETLVHRLFFLVYQQSASDQGGEGIFQSRHLVRRPVRRHRDVPGTARPRPAPPPGKDDSASLYPVPVQWTPALRNHPHPFALLQRLQPRRMEQTRRLRPQTRYGTLAAAQ